MLDTGIKCIFDLLIDSPEIEENTLRIVGTKKILSFEKWSELYEISAEEKTKVGLGNSSSSVVNAFISEINGKKTEISSVSFKDAVFAQMVIDNILKSKEEWISID